MIGAAKAFSRLSNQSVPGPEGLDWRNVMPRIRAAGLLVAAALFVGGSWVIVSGAVVNALSRLTGKRYRSLPLVTV
jgi:hypothetical protein